MQANLQEIFNVVINYDDRNFHENMLYESMQYTSKPYNKRKAAPSSMKRQLIFFKIFIDRGNKYGLLIGWYLVLQKDS